MRQELLALYQSLRTQAKEPGDLLDTLERIATTAQKHFSADLCVVFPMNPVTRAFLREKPAVIGKLSKAIKEDFITPRETGLTNRVLTEKILFVEENEIHNFRSPITDLEKIRAFTAFALFTKRLHRPLAVVYLDYKKPRNFDEIFQLELGRFIEFVSAELQNTWFVRRYREIAKIGQDINENLEDIDQMFDKVFEHMKGILDVSYSLSLASYDSQTNQVNLYLMEKGQKFVRKNYTLDENSISLWVIKNLTALIVDDRGNPKNLPDGIQPVHIAGTASEEKSLVFVPLKIKSEPLGVLSIQHPDAGHYDKEDKQILELLANHMALALNNHRLLQDIRTRRLQELEDLRQIDKELSQKTLDRDKVLRTILERTTKYIKADIGVILLHNKKFNTIEAKASIGENLPPLEHQVYSLDQLKGIAKTAFKTKTTIRIDNVRTDSRWKEVFSKISENTTSEMDVPLMLEDEAIGVMNFESSREAAFSKDDQDFMETLAGQAVIAIRNAEEYERAKRVAKEREVLIDIVNTLLLQSDQKEIFSIILRKALEITECSKGTINTCDEDRKEIKIAAESGLKVEWKQRVQTFDEGIIGRVAREKRVIKIDKISTDPLKEEFLDAFPGEEESELAVPILNGNKVMGVINLESEYPYHFEDDDVELIKSLASLCAVAIKNAESIHQKELIKVGIVSGDLAHKMRSPLSKILRLIELIDEEQKEVLNMNTGLSERLSKITTIASDTMNMVQKRLEEAKQNFASIERTSLKLMLNKALDEIEMPEDVIFKNEIDKVNDPLDVFATPELANVFHNLITNSIHAMPDGGKISVELVDKNRDWVIIAIEDTGKGIKRDEAPMVFLPISSKGSEVGRGFGLSLTKAYIEMIYGKISIPVPGKDGIGTKFTIRLKPFPSE